MNKIKVIIKRPDEPYGHVSWISDTLETLQRTVEGYIETVTIAEDAVIICNEEGRINGQHFNCRLFDVPFFGTLIFAGVKGEEFTDFPMSFKDYKRVFFGVK